MSHSPIYQLDSTAGRHKLRVWQRLTLLGGGVVPLVMAGSALGYGAAATVPLTTLNAASSAAPPNGSDLNATPLHGLSLVLAPVEAPGAATTTTVAVRPRPPSGLGPSKPEEEPRGLAPSAGPVVVTAPAAAPDAPPPPAAPAAAQPAPAAPVLPPIPAGPIFMARPPIIVPAPAAPVFAAPVIAAPAPPAAARALIMPAPAVIVKPPSPAPQAQVRQTSSNTERDTRSSTTMQSNQSAPRTRQREGGDNHQGEHQGGDD